jgi:uncharacterized membrane protein
MDTWLANSIRNRACSYLFTPVLDTIYIAFMFLLFGSFRPEDGDIMNRTKFSGFVLGIAGVVLLAVGIYLAISYVGTLMNAMIDFVSKNSGAISNCGITVPDEIAKLKDQVATTIIPGLYLGIPLATIVIAVIMFAGGYFFGRGSYQDQLDRKKKQEEELEEEVERRIGKKGQGSTKEPEEEEEEE